jgi:hypothetical protein
MSQRTTILRDGKKCQRKPAWSFHFQQMSSSESSRSREERGEFVEESKHGGMPRFGFEKAELVCMWRKTVFYPSTRSTVREK